MRQPPQSVEAGQGVELTAKMCGELLQFANVCDGPVRSRHAIEPAPERLDTFHKASIDASLDIARKRMRGAVLPPEFRERTQQFLRGDRVSLCDARDRIIARIKIIEAFAQPTFEDRGVSEVALHVVENLSAGIDSSIHGVDAQQVMAEAMDRRAGKFVETATCSF